MAKKNFKKGVKNLIESIENTDTPHQEKLNDVKGVAEPKEVSRPQPFIVELGSIFTVSNVKHAQGMMNEVALNYDALTIKSAPVTDIDVSFIQLLVAFDKMAHERQINISWNIVLTSEITQLLRHTNMYCTIEPYLAKE